MIHLNKHQAIVIQGSMVSYPIEVAKFYSQFDNVVWSGWDDEREEVIDAVKQTGIPLILNKKPKFEGDRNINYQFVSTLRGIEYFKNTNKNITEVIKIRSDLLVYGLERLLSRVNGSDMSFMHLYNKWTATYQPTYYLDYWHTGTDFPADFIVHGSMDAMYNTFNFEMEYLSDIPPESIILRNYLKYRGFENNFDLNYLKHVGITFFGQWADQDNFYSLSLKNGLNLFKRSTVGHLPETSLFLH